MSKDPVGLSQKICENLSAPTDQLVPLPHLLFSQTVRVITVLLDHAIAFIIGTNSRSQMTVKLVRLDDLVHLAEWILQNVVHI